MQVGLYNDLTINRFVSIGAYLGDAEGNEVLLPQKCVSEHWQVGDVVSVFVYRDSEDRLIATTRKPLILRDEMALLKIHDVNQFGAFAKWGIEKDLMIPFREQYHKLEEGQYALVCLKWDEKTDRLIGTTKVKRFLKPADSDFDSSKPYSILIHETTDLGYRVIVDNQYAGMIYHSDIHRKLRLGERTEGYVYQVREDGKLDVRLEPDGYQKVEILSDDLLEILKFRDGFLPFNDQSDPDDIKEELGMSKKTFKKAIGKLYKAGIIELVSDGIRLKT